MRAAVVLLWASCLWSIARSLLYLLWSASPWRKLAVLTALALAASCRRRPAQRDRQPPKPQTRL